MNTIIKAAKYLSVDKMTLRNLGEVALRDKSPTGKGYLNKVAKIIEETSIPRQFIVNISNIGTGFIIKLLINPFFLTELGIYTAALIATSAHVVCDVIDSTNRLPKSRECKVDGYDENFLCLVSKIYHEKLNADALSSNGASYCVGEGDLALLLLLTNSNSFVFNDIMWILGKL